MYEEYEKRTVSKAENSDQKEGKAKIYSDLFTAYENAEKKLAQLAQQLSALEKEAGKQQNNKQVGGKNISSPEQLYIRCQKELLMKYLPYSKCTDARNINEFVSGLPPQLASQLGADLRDLKNDFLAMTAKRKEQEEEEKKQQILTAIEEFENQNKEVLSKPGRKLALDFYKSFGDFDSDNAGAVLDLTEKVIAAYNDQLSLSQELQEENSLAKSKLTSSSFGKSSPLSDSRHIFSRAEINEMLKTPAGREKFLKVEKIIFDQMAKGLIK